MLKKFLSEVDKPYVFMIETNHSNNSHVHHIHQIRLQALFAQKKFANWKYWRVNWIKKKLNWNLKRLWNNCVVLHSKYADEKTIFSLLEPRFFSISTASTNTHLLCPLKNWQIGNIVSNSIFIEILKIWKVFLVKWIRRTTSNFLNWDPRCRSVRIKWTKNQLDDFSFIFEKFLYSTVDSFCIDNKQGVPD